MKHFLLIAFFCIYYQLSAHDTPTLTLHGGFERMYLNGYIARYDEDTCSDIQALFRQHNTRFSTTYNLPTFKADRQYHWLAITLQSTIAQNLVLELQQVFNDEVMFYLFKGDSLIDSQRSSWHYAFTQKPTPSRYHGFSFEVEPSQHYTLFIRCHNDTIVFSTRAFLQLSNSHAFVQDNDTFLLLVSLCMGCLLFVCMLSLGFYIYSHRRLYLYYFCYIVASLLYALSVNGVLNQFFNPSIFFLTTPQLYSVLIILSMFTHLLYLYDYLKVKDLQYTWLNGTHYMLLGLLLVQTVLIYSMPARAMPFSFFYFPFAFLVLTFLIISVKRHPKMVYLYLVASGPVFITFLIVFLGSMGLIKISYTFFYYGFVPITLETIGLGLALIYQYNTERQQIQTELEEQRRSTTQKVMQAQEEERLRMALDLHDDLGGTLAFLQREFHEINQKNKGRFTDIYQLVQKSVNDLRMISHNMMPTDFEGKGLKRVIEEGIELANRQGKTNIVFISNGNEHRFDKEKEVNIYRIIKELLNNALKHANATQIVVQVIFYQDFLYVSVEDDGHGFDFSSKEQWGIGLKNVHLRCEFLHTKLTTETSPKGTLFAFEVLYEPSPQKI